MGTKLLVYLYRVARFINQKLQKISVGIINDLHIRYVVTTQLLMFVTVSFLRNMHLKPNHKKFQYNF